MYFYAARQPILDIDKNLFAYELLFRDSIINVFPDIDGDEATTKIIEASNFNLGISEFTGNKPAFINFTLETLIKGYPETLTPEEVVVEILETVKPGKKLLSICKDLHKKGYTIALDDYIHQSVWQHFYPFIHIIKIDWQITTLDTIEIVKAAIKDFPHIKLLAEKVETYEEYNQALALDFELFQGFFFAKPEMIKTKSLSPSQIAMAELLYETSKKELDLASITSVFERDVTLSYKLLRYANSAIFKRRTDISTIKQALVILGSAELIRFLGLMFAANINPDKPSELINEAMIRAKFCDLMASEIKSPLDSSIAFLTGLLSLIDAIVDEDLANILTKLPLAQEIKDTLLTRKGDMAALIMLLEFIERAEWSKTNIVMAKLGLNKATVLKSYNQAIAWADEQKLANY
ncbi:MULTISPECIES: EAL and HDOD domain-containing protein [unclassified Colwellia]|uniref:EAL and HDOD domain-containing protein n=1 Tax=unclassified Colwellia TaxID=196834 RepID=UPI0015F6F48B|nr:MULTISPECIES: HDOD domain-containing protein [unclassified Colwellia]MBA6224505.1 HDOD domain-containing protein [Colwellia sp. MB3u-45]MBA6267625.1 HDOD domain-containing protein [Colwellia sp. MB3u-43]MBA6288655.1 HDOD domain-containing protein [Colwellia sp. MB3u-4]MBA6294896.1 HDOD domain-containing protein [Colwellia sp. MB02u-9]MBA6322199.1 HDOD domain-containing protein [Colwellia sp. MB02u-19]